MENNLILEFQKTDCIILSIMQSVMKFFKYEAKPFLYYGIGNARVLTLPFFTDCESYFRKCFAYVNDVCYFSGAWNSDFITYDARGFINKLKEKWFEWADMQQEMPIIVGLYEELKQRVDFYILVGYEKKSGLFKFMNKNGEITVETEALVEAKYKLFGFATIDVPYNFMVKNGYYIDADIAGTGLVQRAGYFLSNNHDMMNCFNKIMKAIDDEDYNTTKSIVKTLYNNLKMYEMPFDLYRNSYGIILSALGYEELGNQYKKLSTSWTEIIDVFQKYNNVALSLVKATILLENELIKKQKGIM